MKAAVNTRYGAPEDVLQIKEVPEPVPEDNQVLIKVYAASVNRTDCGFLRAKPFIVRFFSGLVTPKNTVLGCAFAGTVTAAGKDVTLFKPGDRVFGFDDAGWGGHAEFKVIGEDRMVTTIPEGATFEQAAASTEGGHYALNYVRVIEGLEAQSILVHGATGAIGTAAVQLLKHAGMRVVATSTTKNVALVASLGADHVIDWQKEDFTQYDEQFDVVFDAVGKSSIRACRQLLKKGGTYIGTDLGYMAQNPLLALASPLFKVFGARRVLFPIPKANKEVVEFLKERIAQGDFKPVIDKTYPFRQIVDAYQHVETGQKTGNVVITITLE